MEKIGKAYGFFDCEASKEAIESQMPSIREACQKPPVKDRWHEFATLRVVFDHYQNSTIILTTSQRLVEF